MRLTIAITMCAAASSLVAAGPLDPKGLPDQLARLTAPASLDGPPTGTPPRFAFTDGDAVISPDTFEDAGVHLGDFGSALAGAVIGKSADGTAAWIAVDVEYGEACGMEGCEKIKWPRAHASALYDATGHAVAFHVGMVFAGNDRGHPVTTAKPTTPETLATGVDAGAEDAVKLFEASIGDPKALAKTVSTRKDAVLLGSELPERYVGGAKVRAQLVRWNLGFTVRDGVQAGVTASKTVAWVAANVDAAKPGSKKTTPYRVLAIYEKTAAGWQLVVLHFSTPFKLS